MFSRLKNVFFYATAAVVLFGAGWACSKYNNPAGISDDAVVAMVGDHAITFKDWMKCKWISCAFSPRRSIRTTRTK